MGLGGRGARMHAAASHHFSEDLHYVQQLPAFLTFVTGDRSVFPMPGPARGCRRMDFCTLFALLEVGFVSLRRRGDEVPSTRLAVISIILHHRSQQANTLCPARVVPSRA